MNSFQIPDDREAFPIARHRFRDDGFSVGIMQPGNSNSIADVPGVRVGHVTLNASTGLSRDVCTGVTAILPHPRNLWHEKVTAASYVINGFGKTTGLVQVGELGEIEAPILLTNTFGVPAATEGVLRYMMQQNPEIGDTAGSLNVVVGECNDSYLSDMRGLHVRAEHVLRAINLAHGNTYVEEGCVGAGTGMRCFGWKGGIGSASRQVTVAGQTFTIGLLVLTNFGVASDLTILGRPVGETFRPDIALHERDEKPRDGSIILVLGTDLPISSRELERLAKRTTFGLARTGSIAHHGSGDIVLAFSTSSHPTCLTGINLQLTREVRMALEDGATISNLFRAVVESTEEAIINSLWQATTTTGKGGRIVQALPTVEVAALLRGESKANQK